MIRCVDFTGLAALTGCTVTCEIDAPIVDFPLISVERVADEFDFRTDRLEDRLRELVSAYREDLGIAN